jgi:hypothetical protein
MKKIILLFYVVSAFIVNLYAQCDTLKLDYKKVINNFYGQKYTKSPVIIVAEFFKTGLPKDIKRPGGILFPAFNNVLYFQCVNPGDNGKPMPKTGEIAGDFFVIDKQHADVIAALKQGDRIIIIGNTYIQSPQDLSSAYNHRRTTYGNENLAKLKERAKLFFIVRGISLLETLE